MAELGPANLQTTILQVDPMKMANTTQNIPINILFAGYLIKLLSDEIVDSNYEIREIASEALYSLLSTVEGKNALNDTYKNVEYSNGSIDVDLISPFITVKCEPSNTHISPEGFKRLIQMQNCWWPEVYSSEGHITWLKSLVTGILNFFIHPTYLKDLIPLCDKKVSTLIILPQYRTFG